MTNDHKLIELIRVINPENFSESTHGAGHRVLLAKDEVSLHKPGLNAFVNSLTKRNARHCFVKFWSVPKEINDWTFRWSEGTNAIGFNFTSKLVIQANEDMQALTLAKVLLRKTDEAGEALYGLINARLHEQLAEMLRRCDERTLSLLDEFKLTPNGIGESVALNEAVTAKVRQDLPGVNFRIGFQLKDPPPRQIDVRCRDDWFVLADSQRERKAETTALLQLENYQAFKKSGLETKEAVEATIKRVISQSVKKLLFARKYYAVVQSFLPGESSIRSQMKEAIEAEARSIGYRVEMFQTFPDIAALELLDPLRIEIPANDEKYYLVDSTGYVQVSLTLSVQIARDFSKLHLLIGPDEPKVAPPIVDRVRQICRDTIHSIDRKTFNLEFDKRVVPALTRAIVNGLGLYGLHVKVINLLQVPTEEALRFLSIRGGTIDFRAKILPHADAGNGEAVPVIGSIEVTGMTEAGWPQFESKDFGYRQDTQHSEARLRDKAGARGLSLPTRTPMPREDRRALAIELELAEIRDRVVSVLEGEMSMSAELAHHWTNADNSEEIAEWAEKMAQKAILNEFGLQIALRGFRRLATESDITLRVQNDAKHAQLREVAKDMAIKEIGHQQALRDVVNENQLGLLRRHALIQNQALSDEFDPKHADVLQRIQTESERIETLQRSAGTDAAAILPNKPMHETALTKARMPWKKSLRTPTNELPALDDRTQLEHLADKPSLTSDPQV